jgi:preprotein translocase subunit SecB
VKDLSLEIPNARRSSSSARRRQVDIQLHHNSSRSKTASTRHAHGDGDARRSKDKTLFLVEAAQAGIFVAAQHPARELERGARHRVPNILFPYVREVISDTSCAPASAGDPEPGQLRGDLPAQREPQQAAEAAGADHHAHASH